jgi:hypothetical protein
MDRRDCVARRMAKPERMGKTRAKRAALERKNSNMGATQMTKIAKTEAMRREATKSLFPLIGYAAASGPLLSFAATSGCCGAARQTGLSRILQHFCWLKRRCADFSSIRRIYVKTTNQYGTRGSHTEYLEAPEAHHCWLYFTSPSTRTTSMLALWAA